MRLRLTAFTVLLIIFSMALVGGIAVWTMRGIGYQRTLESLDSIANVQRAHLSSVTGELVTDLYLIARQPSVENVLTQLRIENEREGKQEHHFRQLDRRFQSIVSLSPNIDEIFLLNPEGYVCASSEVDDRISFRRHEYYFKQIAYGGKESVIYIQDRVYSSNTEQLNAIIAAIPVNRSGTQSPPYVLAIRTSPEALNTIVSNFAGLGETGEILVVSSNQSLVTKSRFSGYDSATAFLVSEPIAKVLQESRSLLGTFIDYRGRKVIGSYSYLPTLNAVLVAKQEEHEALKPVYTLLWYTVLAMIPAAAFAMFAAVIIARRTTAPLLGLEKATTAISQGDFSMPIAIDRKDEIGQLASNFEFMRDSIRQKLGELAQINKELQAEIDQRQLAEASLQQAQKLEAIGRVAGGVAHDFNNMLSVISGFSELCLLNIERSSPLNEWLNEIMAAVNRSSTLTTQLLAYSRQQVMEPAVIDFATFLQEHTASLHKVLGPDIEYNLRYPEKPVWVYLDSNQFSRVIMNFATNARDAMERKGEFTVSLEQNEDQAVLYLHDSGPGIDESIRDTLFEPFVTTKTQGKGTGLGLAMVEGIVKQSGGSIRLLEQSNGGLQTAEAVGTTFQIILSTVDKTAEDHSDRIRKEHQSPMHTNSHVLIVDDEPASVEFLQRLLMHYGYRTTTSTSSLWAVEHIDQIKPDILLSDVKMPEMDGDQLAHKLLERNPQLKVLLISGAVDRDQSYGDFHVLAKPLSRMTLLKTLEQLLTQD